eukprot:403350178
MNSNQLSSQSTQNTKNGQKAISSAISTVLRQGSSDKIPASSLGSTGGSQSFTLQISKKPQLKLSSNLINHSSIIAPQTTQNIHSSRMTNYQNPHFLNQNNSSLKNLNQYSTRMGGNTSSTPKTQTSSSSQINQNSNNQQNQQPLSYSSSLLLDRKSTKLSKTREVLCYQTYQIQLMGYRIWHNESLIRAATIKIRIIKILQSIKINNIKNLLQHQTKQKSISQAIQEQTLQVNQNLKSLNQKNLQISIPSSPRNEEKLTETERQKQPKQQQEPQQLLQKGQIHSGSLSTTNQNQGNIKLNKFTCNSTRNQSQKQNIFSQQSSKNQQQNKGGQEQKNNEQKPYDFNSNPDSMPLQPAHKIIIPNHESTKHSVKRNGVVRAYAANTNQGLVRNYNEDRVSIILNILKPPNRKDEHWPRCSFFGIYDGHGGSACADFLRDNLHQFVIKEPSFPADPKEALMIGFVNAEKKFMELCQNENGIIDKSGSCAIVALIVEDMCYIANVGDSRAIMSSEQGHQIIELSRDHKPNDDLERKRIIEGGGQIYHRTATTNVDEKDPSKKEIVVGPLRVLPGRLSVSRTFGDAEAKIQKFGGNPNVVIATPEIRAFRISSEHDFIVLGCDGIFDKLSNQDTIACVWNSVEDNKQLGFAQNIHKQSGMAVEYILKNSLLRRTLDNVTIVMIAFNNFKHTVFGQTKSKQELKRKQVKGSSQSNHRSNENSLKENLIAKKNNLGINTNTNCSTQGPATTTNAQLQRDGGKGIIDGTISFLSSNNQNQIISQKKLQVGQTTNNSRSKHFDFSNA